MEAQIQILNQYSLRDYNTFGIDVSAKHFCKVKSIEDVRRVLSQDTFRHGDHLFIGGGSNILFTENFNGLVIVNEIKGKQVVSQDEEFVYVKLASGEVWHDAVLWTVENNWGGIENLSLIPGSVGAGPMQNIGAYGVELKDCFYELEALHLSDMEMHVFNNASCRFGYRESVFKNQFRNQYFIVSVTLKLRKHPITNSSYGAIASELSKNGIETPSIRDISNAVIAIRQSKLPDPKVLGNAGSFFKNPEVDNDVYERLKLSYPDIVGYPLAHNKVKLAAGWLIEKCGWKGKIIGHTGSHKDQALVLVNYGGAKGNEVYELALTIRQSILEKFEVRIELEVNIF